jgi:hypothetical protein
VADHVVYRTDDQSTLLLPMLYISPGFLMLSPLLRSLPVTYYHLLEKISSTPTSETGSTSQSLDAQSDDTADGVVKVAGGLHFFLLW